MPKYISIRRIESKNFLSVYPPWTQNPVFHYIFFKKKISIILFPVAAFCVYWLVPFIVTLLNGTAFSMAVASKIRLFVDNLFCRIPLIQDYVPEITFKNISLPYVLDFTHFTFATVASLACAIAIATIKRVHWTVSILSSQGIPNISHSRILSIYLRHRSAAQGLRVYGFCLAMGIAAFATFIEFVYDDKYYQWWGSINHGISGILFSLFVGLMVFLGSLAAFQLLYIARMITALMRRSFSFRPFHRDGCSGLQYFGQLVLFLWADAIFSLLCVYLVFRVGYLGIVSHPVIWVMGIIASIVVPFIAFVPIYFASRQLQRLKVQELGRLEIAISRRYNRLMQSEENQETCISDSNNERLSELISTHETVRHMNIWPFNRGALVPAIAIGTTQITLISLQFVNFFFGG